MVKTNMAQFATDNPMQGTIYPFDPYTYGTNNSEFNFGLTKALMPFNPNISSSDTQPTTTPSTPNQPQQQPQQRVGNTAGRVGGGMNDYLTNVLHMLLGGGDQQIAGNTASQSSQSAWHTLPNGQAYQFPSSQSPYFPQVPHGSGVSLQPNLVAARAPGQASPRNFATGGPTDLLQGIGSLTGTQNPSYPNPTNPPLQNAPTYNGNPLPSIRGTQQGGPGNQDNPGQSFANANTAVHPNLANSLSMANMIGSMAFGGPLGALGSLALGSILGGGPFNQNYGPSLSQDAVQSVADAWNNTPGALTNKMAAANKALANAREVASGGQVGGAGPGLSAGIGVDRYGKAYQSNIGGAGVSHNSQAGAGNAPAGGSYGGGNLGGGPGAEGAGRDPNGPPGSWKRGGKISHQR